MRLRLTTLAALAALALPGAALAQSSDGPVVRPQKYTASEKIEIGPLIGYVSNDPYNRIIVPGIVGTYHYGEHSAVEVHGGYAIYTQKQLQNQVFQKIGRDPDVISRPTFFVTGNYVWSPIYGKLNAFGELVLHYDMYVLAGAGIVSDEIETNTAGTPSVKTVTNKIFPATDFALGQHFFLSKKTALRVEIRPYIFWEQIDNKWDPNGDVQINLGFTLLL
jgi:outer membrane beta-barrel protein